ncbi:Uncharacterised protein [Bordetella pertussis]|nr:Uncharacterised protein [Bordetella pertussis]CFO36868.1 Uncharacterised protein [Bordetella pertussis]CFP11552.1 Uncharacterised protein [Bordetella pertussis]CFP61352.1 Uncharacterised protein [Bordetella pertussis]CPK84559.1 Uncharacterised protein [Bordetella pertussis]
MPGLGPHVGGVDLVLLHVVRQAQVRRAGAAGRHGAEGRAHRAGNLVGAVDGGVPLGQRAIERLLVQLGQRVLAARAHRYVGSNPQHGHRRLVGLDQARQQVGGAAAAGPLAHAHLARYPRVGVGHVGGAALVARQDVLHAVVQPLQRVAERQAGVAAQPENVLDPIQLEHAHHGFGAVELCHGSVLGEGGMCGEISMYT